MKSHPKALTDTDLETLQRSFITPELAAQAGLYRVSNADGAELVGRRTEHGKSYAGIVFPYQWPGDTRPHEFRLRRDKPDAECQPDGSTKETGKYLSPPGKGGLLYFVSGVNPQDLAETSVEILLTEGEKKALAIHRFNEITRRTALVVGLPGVWNWRGKVGKELDEDGGRRDVQGVIPAFDRIVWTGRKVTIIFDTNARTNPKVRAARRELARELMRRGAVVFIADLPESPGVNGPDDFLHLQGPDAFAEVLAGRTPIVPLWRDPEFILQCLEQGELGDALLFAERFRNEYRYDHTAKAWYRFEGHAWTQDRMEAVFPTCSKTLRRLYLDCSLTLADEARRVVESVGTGDDDAEARKRVDELDKKTKHIRTRAFELNRTKRTANVLQFARSLDDIGMTGDEWDAGPWRLAVENGVLDLRTGTLRPGRPDDFIRTVAPVRFDSLTTPCPTFERFLASTFDGPDAGDIITFLHRLLGYSITGQCVEHRLPILYGEKGRNGKDTLLETLSFVLGPFASPIAKEVLLAGRDRSSGGASPHLCTLQGKRLVWLNETNDGERLDAGQVKLLTGGGQIVARQVFREETRFHPTHTAFLMTNRKPNAPDDDAALWARLMLIPFRLRFVENPNGANEREADPKLLEKLKAEASGILAWLVRGALEWQRGGLRVPDCVKAETEAYRAEQDTVSQFIDECCHVDPKAYVPAGALFEAYQTWADSAGIRKTAQKNHITFSKRISQTFEKAKGIKGTTYHGIGLSTGWNGGEMTDLTDLTDFSQRSSHEESQFFTFGKVPESPSSPSSPSNPSQNGNEKAETGGRKRVKV